MPKRLCRTAKAITLLTLAAASLKAGPVYSFTQIVVPGADLAYPTDINDAGQIVGNFFTPANYGRHGYIDTGGSFTQIDMPGAAWTTLTGINNTGQIIGTGFGIGNFIYDGVNFTQIAVPGATATGVYGINDAGEIVGEFHTLNNRGLTDVHGFVFSDGSFTEVNVPGSVYTSISAINNAGQIVGVYETETGSYSFLGTPVPEPGTITLLGIVTAIIGLIKMGRIQARSKSLSRDE